MGASYPATIKVFTAWQDYTDIIYALHPNEMHDEIVAIESTLGTNPQGGAATVADRIGAVETGKSPTTHTHGTLPYPVFLGAVLGAPGVYIAGSHIYPATDSTTFVGPLLLAFSGITTRVLGLLNVIEAASFNSTLSAAGAVHFTSTLAVDGASTFTGTMTAGTINADTVNLTTALGLGAAGYLSFAAGVVGGHAAGVRNNMQWNFDGHGMFTKDQTGGGGSTAWASAVILSHVVNDTTNKGLCLWTDYGNLSPIIKTDSGGAGGTSGAAGANWYTYGFQFRDQADAAWVPISASAFVVPSAERLKEDISEHAFGLDAVMALRPVKFQHKQPPQPVFEMDEEGRMAPTGETVLHAPPKPELGFIAEEMHQAGLTDVVRYEDDKPAAYSLSGMVSVLVKAVQEQQAMIEDLRSEIATLKG